jgi:hypothetical protein
MLALRDDGGDKGVDGPNKIAAKPPFRSLNRNRGRISNVAQNAHGEPSLEEFGPLLRLRIASGTPPRDQIGMNVPLH